MTILMGCMVKLVNIFKTMKKKLVLAKIKSVKERLGKDKRAVVFLIAILFGGSTLYFLKGQLVVAMVNGRPISRLALIKKMEKQAGKSTLNALITETLILQEAKKQNVVVADEEVDQEIKKLEENLVQQGQDLNQLLSLQGSTKDELKERMRIQKIVEKIVGQDIKVTDEEMETYLEQNKESIPEDTDIEEVKTIVKEQLGQQKLNEKIQSWVKSLNESANIKYFLEF